MSASADIERTKGDILLADVLRPAPTLPPKALLAILGVVAVINLAFMISFALRGAWPVAPFMGADVAILAWAFRQSRIAAQREERVTLTHSQLHISRRPPPNGPAEISLNPYWVRVEMDDPPKPGSQLTLWSHGKGVRIGAFLPPLERVEAARRLKSALRRVRNLHD